ncbi:MAG: hypothetical protein K1X72_13720 [Pyrinomonadaceae bacterium]|nr:hypothetical protein [Pyrinomonadaceae bacterium]
MSIFAGIYCRQENKIIPKQVCEELNKLVSRKADTDRIVFKNDRNYLVKVDLGIFDEIGHFTDLNGEFSVLAGEPLLSDSNYPNRKDDLIKIHQGLESSNYEPLETAQGVFCLVNIENNQLTLLTDKLGIRPIYYWFNDDFVIFATALRILENLSFIPKKMSVRAVTEVATLGYPLGNRTPYEDIFVLKSAEIVKFKNKEIKGCKYWNWDKIKISEESEEVLLKQLQQHFTQAVNRRLKRDKTTIAYLSGGLDSRCIVGALVGLNARVHTFNFARPNTQDQILGREFAKIAGVIHTEIPKEPGDIVPDYSAKMAEAWKKSENKKDFPAEHPNLIWSGEGGSVALGHVHLSPVMIDLMRLGKLDETIDEYTQREHIYLSPKLLQKKVFTEVSAILRESVSAELAELDHQDAARNFYIFLLQNDQRRKLYGHFENIDLHGLEFQLPFFDSQVLGTIISIPIKMCLRHKIYVKWLYHLPEIVTSVSWQVYPGHEPCPLPIPDGLSYQWDDKYQNNEQKSKNGYLIRQGKEMLNSNDFPSDILSRKNIRLAVLIHQTGWRDYSYIIENAITFYRYWKICKGNYCL